MKKSFTKSKLARRPSAKQQGLVLLESLIAVLIFSMGILALVGLQTAMLKNTSDAKFRADASFVAQQKLGDIWLAGTALANHEVADEDVSIYLPAGRRSVSISGDRVVTITVTWQVPGNDIHTYSTSARIEGI